MKELMVALLLSFKVIDGDTIEFMGVVSIDGRVWPGPIAGLVVEDRVRLDVVNTPEKKASSDCEREMAMAAQRFTERNLNAGKTIFVRTAGKRDAFGRVLATISIDGKDLGDSLLKAGHARPYSRAKEPWC